MRASISAAGRGQGKRRAAEGMERHHAAPPAGGARQPRQPRRSPAPLRARAEAGPGPTKSPCERPVRVPVP